MKQKTIVINGQETFEQYNKNAQLINMYLLGQLNENENEKMEEWLISSPEIRKMIEEMKKEDWLETITSDFRPLSVEESFKRTMAIIKKDSLKAKFEKLTAKFCNLFKKPN